MFQVVKPPSISSKTEEIKSGKNRYIISAYISLVVYFSSRSHIEAISYILWKFLSPSILLLLKRGKLVKYFESGTFVEKYILWFNGMFFCVQSKLSAQLWVFKTYELDYDVLLNIPIEISSQPMQIFIKSNKYP